VIRARRVVVVIVRPDNTPVGARFGQGANEPFTNELFTSFAVLSKQLRISGESRDSPTRYDTCLCGAGKMMARRNNLRFFACATLIATATAACETYDPGNPLRTRPVTVNDPNEPAPDGANTDDDDDDNGSDGTTTTPPTFVPPAPTPNNGVFKDAPAYVATAGATTRKAQHNFAGNTPTTNPAGRACMQCHGAAGPAPRFVVGGTIYKDAAGTMPAARVEVRIVDAQNKATTTYTDADGNYFIKFNAAPASSVMFPIRAGVRDSDSLLSMRAGAAAGNCNSCHKPSGASTPIAIP
jgi:hypothetical protein